MPHEKGEKVTLVLVAIEPEKMVGIWDAHIKNELVFGCAIQTIGTGDMVSEPDMNEPITVVSDDAEYLVSPETLNDVFVELEPTGWHIPDLSGCKVKTSDNKIYTPVWKLAFEETPE